jgi:transposase
VAGKRLAGHQKKAKKEGRTLVFVDESGFFLRPAAAKTWSPAGRTPVLRAPLRRERLSVIGGLTWQGSLYTQVHRHVIDAEGAVAFVSHLLRHIPGRLLMLWDGARIHTGRRVQEFRRLDTRGRLEVELFPPYAPELDPQEYVWRQLKHVDLRNLTSHSLDQLWARLRDATHRLRQRVGLLRNLVQHAGLGT